MNTRIFRTAVYASLLAFAALVHTPDMARAQQRPCHPNVVTSVQQTATGTLYTCAKPEYARCLRDTKAVYEHQLAQCSTPAFLQQCIADNAFDIGINAVVNLAACFPAAAVDSAAAITAAVAPPVLALEAPLISAANVACAAGTGVNLARLLPIIEKCQAARRDCAGNALAIQQHALKEVCPRM